MPSIIKFDNILADITYLKELASTYQLDFASLPQQRQLYSEQTRQRFGQYALISDEGGVGLVDISDPKLLPLRVDFAADALIYRKDKGGGKNEAIAKAIGIKKNAQLNVIDATAGLGTDSFIMASVGANVTMMERTAIVSALLHDGLIRGGKEPNCAEIVARMRLASGDAREQLQQRVAEQDTNVDVVYLDPMFPHKKKSAAVKKPMKMFQTLIGSDLDADDLLTPALSLAQQRVVVKRPNYAPFLQDHTPTMQIKGKKHRFDVYLTHRALRTDHTKNADETQTPD